MRSRADHPRVFGTALRWHGSPTRPYPASVRSTVRVSKDARESRIEARVYLPLLPVPRVSGRIRLEGPLPRRHLLYRPVEGVDDSRRDTGENRRARTVKTILGEIKTAVWIRPINP